MGIASISYSGRVGSNHGPDASHPEAFVIFLRLSRHGCELWGCAIKTNIHIIQRFQSKILREIANAPWFVSNHTLHTDFQIPLVQEVIQGRKRHHRRRIEVHTNSLMGPLLQVHNNRKLVRVWPTDVQKKIIHLSFDHSTLYGLTASYSKQVKLSPCLTN
jgi:hypothetical protein